jgi:hypothetical protein
MIFLDVNAILLSAMNLLSDLFRDILQVLLILSSIGKSEKHGKGDKTINSKMDSRSFSGKENHLMLHSTLALEHYLGLKSGS